MKLSIITILILIIGLGDAKQSMRKYMYNSENTEIQMLKA